MSQHTFSKNKRRTTTNVGEIVVLPQQEKTEALKQIVKSTPQHNIDHHHQFRDKAAAKTSP
jgi:hypothetical protein